MSSLQATDVFGTQRREPLNYIERDRVDNELRNNLNRGRHVVIHGGSKQGKTCLRYHCLDPSEYIEINCQYSTNLIKLNKQILKSIGYETEMSNKKTIEGHAKLRVKLTSKIPGVGGGETSSEAGGKIKNEKTTTTLDLDPKDVNDIIRAINKVEPEKFIVIEDFHYLPLDVQKEFASCLKALHQRTNVTFVIVGVWLEKNKSIMHSGDLGGRVISVNADEWRHDELLSVINKGAEKLNIKFDEEFKEKLVEECYESVYIIQESCLKACKLCGVENPQPDSDDVLIADELDAEELIDTVVHEQDAKYRGFLRKFANGFRETKLELYKWIMYSVVSTDPDDLEDGLGVPTIMRDINKKHPKIDDVNQGNLTQSLERIVKLQVERNVEPIILDYNNNDRRLDVVDKRFLIWLDNKSRSELNDIINVC